MNDNLIEELNRLRTETMGTVSLENAYKILLACKEMSIAEIKQYIEKQLRTPKIDNDVRYLLAWAYTNINAGLSKREFDVSLDGIADIIDNQKDHLENELLMLFAEMIDSGDQEYAKLAESFLKRRATISLFDQMVRSNILIKQAFDKQESKEKEPNNKDGKNF